MLSEANLRISQTVSEVATQYLQILLDGGDFGFVSDDFQILGLRNAEEILRDVLRVPFSRDRAEIGRWGDPLPALLEGLRRILPMRPAEDVVEGVEEPLGARTTAKPFVDRERRTAPTSQVLSIAAFKHRRDRRSVAR